MKLFIVLILCMSFGMASAETTLIKAEQLTVKLSDQGFESGFCSPEGSLYWSDEEWEFLPYIQEQRKTKFFKTADEAFGAAFKFIQEHRMW